MTTACTPRVHTFGGGLLPFGFALCRPFANRFLVGLFCFGHLFGNHVALCIEDLPWSHQQRAERCCPLPINRGKRGNDRLWCCGGFRRCQRSYFGRKMTDKSLLH